MLRPNRTPSLRKTIADVSSVSPSSEQTAYARNVSYRLSHGVPLPLSTLVGNPVSLASDWPRTWTLRLIRGNLGNVRGSLTERYVFVCLPLLGIAPLCSGRTERLGAWWRRRPHWTRRHLGCGQGTWYSTGPQSPALPWRTIETNARSKKRIIEQLSNKQFKNWFELSVRLWRYGCTREVEKRAREKRKSCFSRVHP